MGRGAEERGADSPRAHHIQQRVQQAGGAVAGGGGSKRVKLFQHKQHARAGRRQYPQVGVHGRQHRPGAGAGATTASTHSSRVSGGGNAVRVGSVHGHGGGREAQLCRHLPEGGLVIASVAPAQTHDGNLRNWRGGR